MGFGFGLLFFPMLLLSGVVSLVWLWRTPADRQAGTVQSIALLYGAGFLTLVAIFFLGRWGDARRAPIQPSREDILGVYRVDRSMFPGAQAEWQYEHHRILITKEDSLVLEIMDKGKVIKRFSRAFEKDPVDRLHYRWHFKAGTGHLTHHIIATEPVMYRQHSSFYYVFRSDRYGNMFFRKE